MRAFFSILAAGGLFFLASCATEEPDLSKSLYVTKLPPVWPKAVELLRTQPAGIDPITCNCGAYQDKIAELAYGKRVPLAQEYVSGWARDGCHTLPWDISTVLRSQGFNTVRYSTYGYSLGGPYLLTLAKGSLERGHELIVLIQATRGHHGLHWISLWGYDARRRVFLVYDSQYPGKMGGIGNTTYSISLLESRLPWWIGTAVEVWR